MPQIKLINIVGARPQIIKASAISRAIRKHFSNEITEIIVHTGQHYDKEMSDVFFDELEIHKPHYNLGVGSAGHGRQTSMMITGIEEVLLKEKPDCVIALWRYKFHTGRSSGRFKASLSGNSY